MRIETINSHFQSFYFVFFFTRLVVYVIVHICSRRFVSITSSTGAPLSGNIAERIAESASGLIKFKKTDKDLLLMIGIE
jgi:hypothetical protein